MKYLSTRNSKIRKNFKEVVMRGLSLEGGLYLPESWPKVSLNNSLIIDKYDPIYPPMIKNSLFDILRIIPLQKNVNWFSSFN